MHGDGSSSTPHRKRRSRHRPWVHGGRPVGVSPARTRTGRRIQLPWSRRAPERGTRPLRAPAGRSGRRRRRGVLAHALRVATSHGGPLSTSGRLAE